MSAKGLAGRVVSARRPQRPIVALKEAIETLRALVERWGPSSGWDDERRAELLRAERLLAQWPHLDPMGEREP